MKTFVQWSSSQPSEGPELATNSTITKKKRDRDRLTRMESLLHELVKTKQIIARRTDNAQE